MSASRGHWWVQAVGRGLTAFFLMQLAGWVITPGRLTGAAPGATPTKPVTAACLVVLGLVLGGVVASAAARRVLLALVMLASAETLLAALSGRPSAFSDRLFPDAWGAATPDGNGQMAVSTALALMALALALLLARRPRPASVLAALAFLLGYGGLLGHLYGVADFYSLESATAMATTTSLAVIALAAAVLLRPGMPLTRLVTDRGTAGSLVRQLLPGALVVPPFVGWLALSGQLHAWFGVRYVLSLMALAYAATTVLAVFVGARTAQRVDGARRQAADELEALNAALSERVAVAVAEAEEGRERLEVVLERTPVGIFETDPDGTRRFTNRRWRELAGMTPQDAASGQWTEALHPDDKEWVSREWRHAVEAGREWSARYRYLRPDGTVTWVDSIAVAIRNSAGDVVRWLGSVTDVTDQVRSEERLVASERRYRSVVDNMAEGVVLHDADGRIVTANDAARHLLGLSADDLMGRRAMDEAWAVVRDDGTPCPGEEFPPSIALRTGQAARNLPLGVVRGDGRLVWLTVSSEPLVDVRGPDADPVVTGVVTTFADVTEARHAAAALRRSEEQFRAAMEHAPIGMAIVELDGRFREVNRSLCRLIGYPEEVLVGQTFQQISHPDDLDADLDNIAKLLAGEADHYAMEKRYLTRSGEVIWAHLAVSCARDEHGAPEYLVAQIQDITAARAATEKLTHRALHDPLTGLPNRDLLMDHLSHALARSVRTGARTAAMFCDLDGFKEVNDTHGHDVGDELLISIAERLRHAVRPGDTVARLGGDEFVIVAEDLADASAVLVLAERVRRTLAEPVDLGEVVVRTSGSIGVAVAELADDARSVLREADAAMYRAKAHGRDRVEVSAWSAEGLAVSTT